MQPKAASNLGIHRWWSLVAENIHSCRLPAHRPIKRPPQRYSALPLCRHPEASQVRAPGFLNDVQEDSHRRKRLTSSKSAGIPVRANKAAREPAEPSRLEPTTPPGMSSCPCAVWQAGRRGRRLVVKCENLAVDDIAALRNETACGLLFCQPLHPLQELPHRRDRVVCLHPEVEVMDTTSPSCRVQALG